MTVEILLSNINQEKALAAKDILEASSNLNCCVFWSEWSDMGGPSDQTPDEFIDFYKHMQNILLRPEDFGGIGYDPTTGIVLKFDKDGYEVFCDLQKSKSIEEIQKDKSYTKNDIDKFIKILKKYNV